MAIRICIIGAGAIGSYIACRLANVGATTVVLARGARAAAIRERGISTTFQDGRTVSVSPTVVETAEALDAQDYILVCVKAFAVTEATASLVEKLHNGSRIVFIQNGIPWWFTADKRDDRVTELLDPGRRLADHLPLSQVVGCVTYANVRNVAAGVAQHVSDDTFILGEPGGDVPPPLERLLGLFVEAGMDARTTEHIREEIWLKLWGSVAFNPISALTGMTMDEIINDPMTRPIVMSLMEEARSVAAKQGVIFRTSIEQRLETASKAGRFKTSMLQDLEAGRKLEIDAIIGAVSVAGRQLGIATPTVDVVLGLLRQKARGLGLD